MTRLYRGAVRQGVRQDDNPTRGRWFTESERIAEGYGPGRNETGAIMAMDVPASPLLSGSGLLDRQQLGGARLYRGSGLTAVQDNPNALYPRPETRKALAPMLLGGAYLGARRYGLLGPENEEDRPPRFQYSGLLR
jgi:hypothetical protein